MSDAALGRAAELAIEYLDGVGERPVREEASVDELRAAFAPSARPANIRSCAGAT